MTDEVTTSAGSEAVPAASPEPSKEVAAPKDNTQIKGESQKAPTSRESIEKAFAKVEEDNPEFDGHGDNPETGKTTEQKKAEAKAAKEAEARKATKEAAANALELTTKAAKDAKAKEAEEAEAEDEKGAAAAEAEASGDEDEDEGDDKFSTPPSRFSKDAKAEWADAPQSVRAEINRALSEMEAGFDKYRESAEAYEEFREFHETLKANGQQFEDVVGRYVGVENLLMQRPLDGFRVIANNLGLSLEEVASAVLNRPLSEQQQRYIGTIRQLQGQLQQATGQIQQMVREQQAAAMMDAEKEWKAFADDPAHPRAKEVDVQEWMGHFLANGKADSLDSAYEMAVKLLSDAPSGGKGKNADDDPAAAQTRKARSLKGAPSGGSNPKRKGGPVPSTRDAIASRWREAGL